MNQITEQMELKLIGGYAFVELPLLDAKKKVTKFVNKTIDWVEWLRVKLSNKFSEFKARLTGWNNEWCEDQDVQLVIDEIRKRPVTKRSKSDKNWLIMFHVRKAARSKTTRAMKRFKRTHKWIFQN